MTPEHQLQNQIALALGSRPDIRLFRNTVGAGWVGTVTNRRGSTITLANARPVTFGLHPGSPDLMGWRSVKITPDMVGQTVAVAVGLEIKTAKGRTSPAQENFLSAMKLMGALSGVARSIEQAEGVVTI